MTTNNPLPVPSAAPRGAVQKTFVPAKVLSGFMDQAHFQLLAGEYLATLSPADKSQLFAEADATRAFVAQLPQWAPSPVVLRDISHAQIDAIKQDPIFMQAFGSLPHRFCYIDPTGVVALQGWIEPRADAVPSTEEALLEFALPRTWDVPAEVSLIPPQGPIQVLSSNPAMQSLTLELDAVTGRVILSAPKHLNLIQVVQFGGRFYLKNGYHRVADAISGGVRELPAIVVDALKPEDAALPGVTTFNFGYVVGLQRPPLIGDFHSAAAVETKVRERRYGFTVSLDIKPINIGI